MLNVMRKFSCMRLVFSSSATVYLPSDRPLDESAPLGCCNPYGQTKRMIEQILTDYCTAEPDMKVELLR